jgi:3-methyladenine DNA glycosylase AlkD
MIKEKLQEIHSFCVKNADPALVKKYSRYFKGGYDGFGIAKDLYEQQRDAWIKEWKDEMTLGKYLDLGDKLMLTGRYEEKSFAIAFLQSERKNFTQTTFDRIGNWFDYGINNWATTDVLCMLVIPYFLIDEVISFDKLKEWTRSDNEWQRRAVPVTLVELARRDLTPEKAFYMIEPVMLDNSEYVQKGIGTLLRTLWKKYPEEVESFLMKWKDNCGRLIIHYATEKMDKEYRKRFRKKQ